jgi:tetratricopeptide (TPR) repeat protein
MNRFQKWIQKPQIWAVGLLICGLCSLATVCSLAFKVGKPIYDGTTSYYSGNYRQAIDNYTEIIEMFPGNSYAYYFRGRAYNKVHKYEEAIADFTQVIALNPDNQDAYVGRGDAYLLLNEAEKAIADMTKAIELGADTAGTYNSRGWAHYGILQFDQAIEDYNKAIELDANYAYAYRNRGKAYYRIFVSDYLDQKVTYTDSQELKLAIEDFERFLELTAMDNPDHKKVLKLVEDLKSELEP